MRPRSISRFPDLGYRLPGGNFFVLPGQKTWVVGIKRTPAPPVVNNKYKAVTLLDSVKNNNPWSCGPDIASMGGSNIKPLVKFTVAPTKTWGYFSFKRPFKLGAVVDNLCRDASYYVSRSNKSISYCFFFLRGYCSPWNDYFLTYCKPCRIRQKIKSREGLAARFCNRPL